MCANRNAPPHSAPVAYLGFCKAGRGQGSRAEGARVEAPWAARRVGAFFSIFWMIKACSGDSCNEHCFNVKMLARKGLIFLHSPGRPDNMTTQSTLGLVKNEKRIPHSKGHRPMPPSPFKHATAQHTISDQGAAPGVLSAGAISSNGAAARRSAAMTLKCKCGRCHADSRRRRLNAHLF